MVRINESWRQVLAPEFEKPYFQKLTAWVRGEYATTTVYPLGSQIFHAFDACPFDAVKVVILGQDPYHGKNQAHGLAFSVNEGVRTPPPAGLHAWDGEAATAFARKLRVGAYPTVLLVQGGRILNAWEGTFAGKLE